MVHFTWYDPAALFYSDSQCMNHFMRVTPFGYSRINGYVLLPGTFRSLSRPSSPCSSIGIRHGPIFRLTILFFPHKRHSIPPRRAFKIKRARLKSSRLSCCLHWHIAITCSAPTSFPFSSHVKNQCLMKLSASCAVWRIGDLNP